MDLLARAFVGNYWSNVYFANTLRVYVNSLLIFVFLIVIFKAFQSLIVLRLKRIAKKTKTEVDDTAIRVVQSIKPPFYFFLAFYLALNILHLHPVIRKVLNAGILIWVVYQVILSVEIISDFIAAKYLSQEKEPGSKQAIGVLRKVVKIILWILGSLLVLQNLGVNVTSLVAGLGVGGIAIAFALQSVLEDLFSSFAILFDKPFVVGDSIAVGAHKGVVEKIGIKTTRIRSVDGEEIIISNKELTSQRVLNFRRMKKKRIIIRIGVVYDTPPKTLKEIPKIVKDQVSQVAKCQFERVHFVEFGDSALIFEIVCYALTRDHKKMLSVRQKINYLIRESFEKHGILMAYPTQTVILQK